MTSASSSSSSSHPGNALSLPSANSIPAATLASLEQQVADEGDLRRCATANHQKILSEAVSQLKHELGAIEADDWMYENPKNPGGGDHLPAQFLSRPY